MLRHRRSNNRANTSASFAASTGSRDSAERRAALIQKEAARSPRISSIGGRSSAGVSLFMSGRTFRRNCGCIADWLWTANDRFRLQQVTMAATNTAHGRRNACQCILEFDRYAERLSAPAVKGWTNCATERRVLPPELQL